MAVVLDSSFIVAYHNRRDAHHAAAVEIMPRLVEGEWGRLLLLEYVFVEVVTVLRARLGLHAADSAATILLEAGDVDFVPCSNLFLDALATFRAHEQTALSFTDAAIVTVARRAPGTAVATFDRDFSAAGLAVLPA